MAGMIVLRAQDMERGITVRELDNLVSQATAMGIDWDSPVLVRGTLLNRRDLFAPGLRFLQLTVVDQPPGD